MKGVQPSMSLSVTVWVQCENNKSTALEQQKFLFLACLLRLHFRTENSLQVSLSRSAMDYQPYADLFCNSYEKYDITELG